MCRRPLLINTRSAPEPRPNESGPSRLPGPPYIIPNPKSVLPPPPQPCHPTWHSSPPILGPAAMPVSVSWVSVWKRWNIESRTYYALQDFSFHSPVPLICTEIHAIDEELCMLCYRQVCHKGTLTFDQRKYLHTRTHTHVHTFKSMQIYTLDQISPYVSFKCQLNNILPFSYITCTNGINTPILLVRFTRNYIR